MNKSIKRVIVALNLRKLNSPELISFLRAIAKALNGNDYFTAEEMIKMPISPAEIDAQADNIEMTHTSRKTSRSATLTSLEQEQVTLAMNTIKDTAAFVEGLANKKANGDIPLAIQIITSAGFQVKREFVQHQRSFEVVKTGKGFAHIRTKALKQGVIYHWRWTTNPTDDKSWKVTFPTIEANINVSSLPCSTTVYFSFAVTFPKGRTPHYDSEAAYIPSWSDPISATIL
ncbi:MAG: hypothetical protein V2A54_05850 [Bacteroidota bacterium]